MKNIIKEATNIKVEFEDGSSIKYTNRGAHVGGGEVVRMLRFPVPKMDHSKMKEWLNLYEKANGGLAVYERLLRNFVTNEEGLEIKLNKLEKIFNRSNNIDEAIGNVLIFNE